MAEMVYQGSNYESSVGATGAETNKQWWDLCVLRILAPIKPTGPVPNVDFVKMEILLESLETQSLTSSSSSLQEGVSTMGTVNKTIQQQHAHCPGTPSLFSNIPPLYHPSYPRDDPPVMAVTMSSKRVAVDQVVRLLGKDADADADASIAM